MDIIVLLVVFGSNICVAVYSDSCTQNTVLLVRLQNSPAVFVPIINLAER